MNTGTWYRDGRVIVLDDPFSVEQENGGGPTTPPRRRGPSKRQIALLQQFFGSGEAGARARLANFYVPAGLRASTLRWYAGVARAVLANPVKATPTAKVVQPLRLQLVARALAQVT